MVRQWKIRLKKLAFFKQTARFKFKAIRHPLVINLFYNLSWIYFVICIKIENN